MPATVYLCEKPSQAKDIARELGRVKQGDGFIETRGNSVVTWAFGHLLQLSEPTDYDPAWKARKTYPIFPDEFHYQVGKGKSKQLNVIKRLLRGAATVVIATDSDREGEAIARLILEYCDYRREIKRLWLSALDPDSIRKGLQNLRSGESTYPLYLAARSRAQADWLVGMNLSRAASDLLGQSEVNLSVGRVQTPTLRLIVDRDLAIEGFVSVPFYEIAAETLSGEHRFTLFHRRAVGNYLLDKTEAERLLATLTGACGPLLVTEDRVKTGPPKLFSLSGLQRACNQRWGWSAEKTLKVAQSLYETHKVTSYPRSDCTYLPEEQVADVETILSHLQSLPWFKQQLPLSDPPQIRGNVFNSVKVAQSSHHAIVPTLQAATLVDLPKDELSAYELITASYVAALMPDQERDKKTIALDANGIRLAASGFTPVAPGWSALPTFTRAARVTEPGNKREDEETSATLPPVTDGDDAKVVKASLINKQTQPPKPYTEGTLIADMSSVAKLVDDPQAKQRLKETSGIGTEATRAGIIEVLKKREFIRVEKRNLRSTEVGRALIQALPLSISDPATTAAWEDALDAIAQREIAMDAFMDAIRANIALHIQEIRDRPPIELDNNIRETISKPTKPRAKKRDKDAGKRTFAKTHQQVGDPCPKCGKPLVLRNVTGNQPFWGCSGFPECRHTAPFKPTGAESCPSCSTGHLVTRTAKRGANIGQVFQGCSNYPKCTFIRVTLPNKQTSEG